MQPSQLIREARNMVGELTGLPVENVTGFEPNGEGWRVTLEVLELQRIPSTQDLLGTYEITIGTDGDVSGFRRRRRYTRGASEGND